MEFVFNGIFRPSRVGHFWHRMKYLSCAENSQERSMAEFIMKHMEADVERQAVPALGRRHSRQF